MTADVLVYGDTGTDLVLDVQDKNGTGLDLTGATGIKLVCMTSDRLTVELTATLLIANPARVSIEDAALAVDPGTFARVVMLEGILQWTLSGETHKARTVYRFGIRKWA